MPQDLLTQRLRRHFEAQGIQASDTDLAKIIDERRSELTSIDPTFKRKASLADAIGTGLWHAVDASTAGVLSLTTDTELEKKYGRKWEEKDTNERIAAAIGEVAGLVNPYGAFGRMAKGFSKGVGVLTGKGTSQVFSRSADTAVKTTLDKLGVEGLSELGVKKGLTSKQAASVSNAIRGTFKEKLMKQKAAAIAAKGRADTKSLDSIEEFINPAISQALTDAGVTSGNKALTRQIAGYFRNGVQNGDHINSISRWVAKGMGGVNQTKFRQGLNKYVGMAAQDMVLLTSYNSLAGKVEAKKSGEDMDWGSTLKHSLYLSLAFPAIRYFGGGGQRTLREGGRFIRLWNNVNYKKMDENALTKYLGIMYGGEKAGSNLLKGHTFVLSSGKVVEWGKGSFKHQMDKLSHENKVELAEQIRAFGSKGFRKWGKEWIKDIGTIRGSLPRMVMGAAANNVEMFKDGMWARIPPEELLTHLMIGAYFTRMKGEWNHGKEDRTNLNDYYELFHITGLKPKDKNGMDLSKWLMWNEVEAITQLQGATLSSNAALKPFMDTIRKYTESVKFNKNGEPVDEHGKKLEYVPIDRVSEPHIEALVEYYNMIESMKSGLDPNYKPFKIEHLSQELRAELNTKLGNTEFPNENGKMVRYHDAGRGKLDTHLEISMGNQVTTQIKEFLKNVQTRLKEELGVDYPYVDNSSDDITRLQLPLMGDTQPDATSLNIRKLIQLRKRINNLYGIGEEPKEGQKWEWRKEDEKKVDKIIQEEKTKIEEIYSKEMFAEFADANPVDMFSPAMMSSINMGSAARIENSWLRILGGAENLTQYESSIRKIINVLFGDLTDTVPSWKIIESKLTDGKGKDVESNSQKHAADIKTLKLLHDLVSIGKTPVSDSITAKESPKIDLSKLGDLRDSIDKGNLETGPEMSPLAIGVKQRWYAHELGRHHDASKIHVLSEIQSMGLGIRHGNKIQVMSAKGLNDYFLSQEESMGIKLTDKERTEVVEMYKKATEGYVGNLGGSIEYVDAQPGNPEISVDSIKRMHRMIPDVWWTQTSESVRRLSNNLREKIEMNHFDKVIDDLQLALRDFAVFGADAEANTARVDEAVNMIERIVNVKYGGDRAGSEIVKEGRKIVKALRSDIEAAISERGEGGGTVNIESILGAEGSSALKRAIFEIQKPDYEMINILNDIYQAGQHINTRPEAWMYYNHLRNQLLSATGKNKMTTEQSLDELIGSFNEKNKGVGEWINLVTEARKFIDLHSISRDKSATLITDTEAYLKLQETHHKSTMQELADYYFLGPEIRLDKDKSPWSSSVLTHISKLKAGGADNTIHFNELIKIATSKINSANLKNSEKTQRLEEFMEYGLYHIINSQMGQARREVIKYRNGKWVETTQTVRLTQRHKLIDQLKSEGVELGEILTTAIEGNEVNIYSIMKDPKKLMQLMEAPFVREGDLEVLRQRGDVSDEHIMPVHKAAREGGIVPMVVSASNGFYIPKSQMPAFHNVFKSFYGDTLAKLDNLMKSKSLSLEQKENLKVVRDGFEQAFKTLSETSTEAVNVERKFAAYYMNHMNPVQFLGLFGLNKPNAKLGIHINGDHVASWGDKMVKYSKVFEAQNQTAVSKVSLSALAENHPNPIVRKHAKKKLTSTKILGIADEVKDGAFDLRRSLIRDLEHELASPLGDLGKGAEVSRETEPLKDAIKAMKNEISQGEDGFQYDSIGGTKRNPDTVSTKNAAVYISQAEAMVYSALTNQVFDPTRTQVINGWKPKISYVSADGMEALQQKTWYIYSPRLEPKMLELGVDQIAFGSSLKTFGSLKGDKSLKDMEFSDKHLMEDSSWETTIKKGDIKGNIIDITNPESISIGFTNHPGTTVSAGNTVTNLMPRKILSYTQIWQGLGDVVNEGIGLGRRMQQDARTEIAEALYKWQKQDSGGFISDDASLIQTMLELGANTSNVAVSSGINRLWTSKVIENVRRPQKRTGLASYLAHDEIFGITTVDGKTLKPRQVLKMPIYVEAGGGSRRQLRLGEVFAPHDWGTKQVTDVNQLRFVVKVGGVDVVVGYNNANLYREKMKGDEWVHIDPTDGRGDLENLPKNWNKNYDSEIMKAKGVIDNIQNRIGEDVFLISDVVSALKGSGVDVAINTLAIPRKSADMVINRVRDIVSKEYGNNWISNDYETAVVHQRDFDADHFYTFNDLPMQAIKNALFQTAQIRDYPTMDRHKPDINPFGFNFDRSVSSGAAGEKGIKSVGDYMASIEARRRQIGTLIGLNQPLTWMNNLGLELRIDGVDGSKGFQAFNFIMSPENINRTLNLNHRVGTTGQNTVDFFGGKSSMLGDINFRALLFGDGQSTSKLPFQHSSITEHGKAMELSTLHPEIQVDILQAISRRLQGASRIFNDVHEGGKKRNVTIQDIQDTHRSIQAFFNSPSKTIFLDLVRKYQGGGAEQQTKLREVIRFFYGQNKEAGIVESMDEFKAMGKLMKLIKKGRGIPEPEEVIKLTTGSKNIETRSQERWESNNSGFAVRRMFEGSDAFRNPEMVEGLPEGITNPKNKFTPEDMANNIFEATVLLKAFGVNRDSREAFGREIVDEMIPSIMRTDGNEIYQSMMTDATLHVLNSRLAIAMSRKAFLEGARFPNKEELSRATDELNTLDLAIATVKESKIRNQIIGTTTTVEGKDTVVKLDTKNYKYKKNIKEYKNTDKYNDQFIYSLPKDVGDITSAKLAAGDALNFVGVVRKGESIKGLSKNRDYLVLNKPMEAVPLTKVDAVQGISWLNATRYVSPDVIAMRTGQQGLDVADAIQTVKRNILKNFGRAMTSNKEAPAESGRIWETERAFAYNEIGKLMDRFIEGKIVEGQIRGGDHQETIDTINDLSLLLLMPDPVVKASLDVKDQGIPFFRINKRLHKHVFGWLNENGYLRDSMVSDALKYASEFESYLLGYEVQPDAAAIKGGLEGRVSQWDMHQKRFGPMWSTVMKLSPSPFRPYVEMAYERKGLKVPYKYTKGTLWGSDSRETGYMFWSKKNNMNEYLRRELNETSYNQTTGAACRN